MIDSDCVSGTSPRYLRVVEGKGAMVFRSLLKLLRHVQWLLVEALLGNCGIKTTP